LRRVPIRLKLAAALSIPLLALGVVTTLEVLKSADDVSQIREQTDLAEAAIGPSGLITSLQNERTWPAVDLIGQGDAVNVTVRGYEDTRAETDTALAAFRDEVASKDQSIANAFQPAIDQLADLEQLRSDIDANVAAVNPRSIANNIEFSHEVFDRYTQLIEPFFDATTRISLAIDDPELRQGTEMADAAARQVEVLSLLLNGIISDMTISPDGINTPAEITQHSITHASFERNAAAMLAGTGPYAQIAAEYFPAALTDRVNEQATQAITANQMDLPVMLDAVNVPKEEGYFAYQEAVAAEIVDRGETLNSAAEARQRWFIALAVLVLGTAIFLTWLVSRSITKPLRTLTREAKEMAERRLPDAVIDILETPLGDDVVMPSIQPVRLETRDEVADVSAALNTVQDTALDLAVEQAVLRRNIADSFVNLGRRNQNLLGRQLDFITELETNETDADTLANLFRLDHLATRMRRNAESLLVLAGIEPPRKWAAPVRLTDVIRAALGEVEDYQRVTVRGVEPATIIGNAAADLAHLLAELIENALVFSPPDQTVDIRGRNRPDGYTLAIIDSGLGMPPTDVTAANRRLAGAESFTIAPSKYLGHYVAGNLAARHNIHVHLDNSPGNGITATIDIPPTLLTSDTELAAPVTPPHGTRALAAGKVRAPAALATAPADAGWADQTPDWLTQSAPGAADAGGHIAPLPAAQAEVRRTQSGLVKRTARAGNGAPVGAERPSGDLLDSLSRHSANLGGPAPVARMPAAPAPPAPPRPAPAAPPAWGAPPEPARPPANRSWPAPPPMPPPPEPPPSTWTPTPAPAGWSPAPSAVSPPPPAAPSPPPPLQSRRAPADQPGPVPGGDMTSGGLARRVRGAQLPTTEPVRMRRSAEPPAPRPTAASTPPARTPEQRRKADDVYSFLSNFTAGVQRGIEEATPQGPDDEAPWGG
jgi:signal transduction histidine kinase